MGNLSMIILLVVMVGMFFMMNRSQKKQQQQRQNLLDSMKAGDNVVTIGGLHGVISEINNADKTITLDCEGIFLVFDRASIKSVTPAAGATVAPIASVEEEVTVVTPEETPAEPEVKDTTEEK
ncbi:preprotein translocase subunit YajC [Enterococcus sp. AZ103]|uniref:preprotein translocase subunit YajC n=1 Tax=Enterococcus sp. AZ103 TaxID=2774628 RepID=UPI003F232A0A